MEHIAGKKKKSSGSPSMLAPGFRFHPTDEELIRFYLRRKVCGKGFRFEPISEIDIYKAEPWDLPSFSKLKTRDLEWFFFSVLDKKYGNGARTNRATEKGYWKTTGKDRAVYHRSRIVGMKKTLVYHSGRAPKGLRSNWVMHEYRLTDTELERADIVQDAFVLCRVFQKSGSGPKNGEQYGAPYLEEEWEDNEFDLVPKLETAEEVDLGGEIYLEGRDLEQILRSDVPSNTSLPCLRSTDCSYGDETADSGDQKRLVGSGKQCYEPEQHEYTNFYSMPALYDMNIRTVKHEYIGESSKSGNSDDLDYLLDEPYFDSYDNLQLGNGGFIEANEYSSSHAENNSSAFDSLEYLAFLDANNDKQQFLCDPLERLGSEDIVSDQSLLPQKEPNDESKQSTPPSEPLRENISGSAMPSDRIDPAKCESDFQYPFMKQASHIFTPKDTALGLNSLSQPSSSVHVTAGMIQIRNLNERDVTLGKDDNLKIILSFGFSQSDDGSTNLESSFSVLPGKTVATVSRGWLSSLLFLILIILLSFKLGNCICLK